MTTEIGPTDLTPYETGGWHYRGTQVYYVHRSRVYLQGMAVNPRAGGLGNPAVTATLLTGLPSAVRPDSDQAVTFLCNLGWTWDVATPPYFTPVRLAATVTTGGDVVLDSLPEWLNAAPPPTHILPGDTWGIWDTIADFVNALQVGVLLGTVNWPLSGAADPSPSWVSLAPYLDGTMWDDVDAEASVLDSRVSLRGRVVAKVSNPTALAHLPSDFIQGLADFAHYAASFTECLKTAGITLPTLTDPAQSTDGRMPLEVDPGGWLYPITDGWADPDPTGDPYWEMPGLSSSPPNTPYAIRGLEAHDDGPSDGSYGYNLRWVTEWPGGDGWCTDNVYWNLGDTYGPCGLNLFGFDQFCATMGATPGQTADLSSLLAQWDEPDWFIITLGWQFAPPGVTDESARGIFRGVNSCAVDDGGHVTGCGPFQNAGDLFLTVDCAAPYALVDNTGAAQPDTYADTTPDGVDPGTDDGTGYPPTASFYLMRTDDSGYQRHSRNTASRLLWRASEVASFAIGFTGESNRGSYRLEASAVPFWEKRGNLIFKGDTIDLTGAGWQAPYSVPVGLLSTIMAGDPLAGLVPRGRVLGG